MTEAPKEKILICCPMIGGIQDTDPNRWLRSYLNIIANIRQMGFSYAPFFPMRMTWYKAMNLTFNIAFENDFTHILRIDDDVWSIGVDYFGKLFEADKDVIGACYATRYFPYVLAALKKVDSSMPILEAWNNQSRNLEEVEGKGIQKVDQIGFGLTLIKVEPFKLLNRPLFPELEDAPDDTYFASICEKNGIDQYVHMDLRMAHRDVTPMNRKYLLNADARMMLQTGFIRKDGTDFNEKMIDNFGEDGMKDFGMLKAI